MDDLCGILYSCLFVIFVCYAYFLQCFDILGWVAGRHPACKKTEWCGAGTGICLGQGADMHMAQLMSLPPTASCFSEIQFGFSFLVPAHPGSPGQMAVKPVLLL